MADNYSPLPQFAIIALRNYTRTYSRRKEPQETPMPAPYSYDLRRKAIAAVKRGERKTEVSRMLNISRNTLDLWLKREAQTGDCQAITHYQQGSRHKITDWQKLREFAQEHGGKTQGQMAKGA